MNYNIFSSFMSIFKTEWIVLQLKKIDEKEIFYKVFFRDYGILSVKKKKKAREKPIDWWYFIACEIITQYEKNIHTIGNIKIKSFFQTEWKSYNDIASFLKILWHIKQELPEWSPHYEIYDILVLFIQNEKHITSVSLLLTQLKIKQCFWNLPDTHIDQTTQKILKFIHTHHYKDILRLKEIPEETQKKLEQML